MIKQEHIAYLLNKQAVVGSEIKSKTKAQGRNNVVTSLGHRAPRKAVIDEHGEKLECWIEEENQINCEERTGATSPTTYLTWELPELNPDLRV
jgi:hypothetical protein